MFSSNRDLFAWQSDDGYKNTKLHEAIINNAYDQAISLIAKDKKGLLANVRALGNTPLMLALKKGNANIAKQLLLNYPNIDVMQPDNRGLTPLHWACMLRLDEIISLLLDKGANPHYRTKRWADSDIQELSPSIIPLDLYKRDVLIENFLQFYAAAEAVQGYKYGVLKYNVYYDQHPCYLQPFTSILSDQEIKTVYREDADLFIPGEMAYTDIIFHLDDICINLGWKQAHTVFASLDGANGTIEKYRSCDVFKHNFGVGITDFCKARNAIPVNGALVERMSKMKKPDSPVQEVTRKIHGMNI